MYHLFLLILNSLKHLLERQSLFCMYPLFLKQGYLQVYHWGDHQNPIWRQSILTSDRLQILVSTINNKNIEKPYTLIQSQLLNLIDTYQTTNILYARCLSLSSHRTPLLMCLHSNNIGHWNKFLKNHKMFNMKQFLWCTMTCIPLNQVLYCLQEFPFVTNSTALKKNYYSLCCFL